MSAGLVDPEFFQQQFIGNLLHLERDEVPNVRMALARMLAAADLTNLPDAVEVLHRLSKDQDRHAQLSGHRCYINSQALLLHASLTLRSISSPVELDLYELLTQLMPRIARPHSRRSTKKTLPAF